MANTPLSRDREYSIFFIGNSYTYFNSMPELFRQIAAECGYDVKVDSVTKGGYKLYLYADPADEYGSKVEAKFNENKYDYVFLQEQSVYPCTETKKFNDGVSALARRAREAGATPLLYQTWGRHAGHSTLAENDWDTFMREGILRSSYKTAAEHIDAKVAYVGAAFAEVYREHPEIELYDPDLTHPSKNGSILAATVLFSTLFGVSPSDIPDDVFEDCDCFTILKQAAEKIVNTVA